MPTPRRKFRRPAPKELLAFRLDAELRERVEVAAAHDGQTVSLWLRAELARAVLRAEKRRARLGGARASVAA